MSNERARHKADMLKADEDLLMTVFVIHYKHRHGDDISVWATRQAAEEVIDVMMEERASEQWEQSDRDRIDQIADFDDRLTFFHSIEMDYADGESIEIEAKEVRS